MRPIYIIGAFIILGLGVLVGYLLWGWWARPMVLPEKQGYDIFKDLVTLILTIGGIVIAIAGYFIYLIISVQTQAAARTAAEEEMQKSSAALMTYIGLSYWYDYRDSGPKNMNYLNQAIDLTQGAYSSHAMQLDERKHEKLVCSILNNLAYYYAKRASPNDRQKARDYAEYIEKRSSKYPDEAEHWEDTVREVRKVYP